MKTFAIAALAAASLVAIAATNVRMQRAPEGVEIRNGVVHLKPGFAFERAGAHKAYSYAIGGALRNQISGTYNCACQGSGGCDAELTKTTLTCVPSGGCNSCQLTVTIGKGGKLGVLRPGAGGGL